MNIIRNYSGIPPIAHTAYVATFSMNFRDFAKKHHLEVLSDHDDLDYFDEISALTDDNIFFKLCRYNNMPCNEVMLFFESQKEDWKKILEKIVASMSISAEDIIHINEDYKNTP